MSHELDRFLNRNGSTLRISPNLITKLPSKNQELIQQILNDLGLNSQYTVTASDNPEYCELLTKTGGIGDLSEFWKRYDMLKTAPGCKIASRDGALGVICKLE